MGPTAPPSMANASLTAESSSRKMGRSMKNALKGRRKVGLNSRAAQELMAPTDVHARRSEGALCPALPNLERRASKVRSEPVVLDSAKFSKERKASIVVLQVCKPRAHL